MDVSEREAVSMAALAEEVSDADEIERSMLVFSRRSLEHGGHAWTSSDVGAAAPVRLYRARASEQFRALAGGRAAAVRARRAAALTGRADGDPAADVHLDSHRRRGHHDSVDARLLSRAPAQFTRPPTARPSESEGSTK